MRELKIILEKEVYLPGEVITGKLELVCDKQFNSKQTEISFSGGMQAKGPTVRTVGPHAPKSDTKKVGEILVKQLIVLSKEKQYDEGSHTYDFSFELPTSNNQFANTLIISSGAYPSYEGRNASIMYRIHAKIFISMIKSVSAEVIVPIIIPLEDFSKVTIQDSVDEKGEKIVDIETDSDLYCIGSPFELRYRINTELKINKIKFEIVHHESTFVEGDKGHHEETLCKVEITPKEEDLHKWLPLVLQPDRTMAQSFISQYIHCEVKLKVTVERPKWNWPEVEVPLISVHCPDDMKLTLTERKTISPEDIELILAKKKTIRTEKVVAQNKCPHCSTEMSVAGMIRADGSVICPECFKRFKPENI